MPGDLVKGESVYRVVRRAGGSSLLVGVLVLLALVAAGVRPVSAQARIRRFTNPVLGQGQDPSVTTYHRSYYLVQSGPANIITVRRARSLLSLAAATRRPIWQGGRAGSPCCGWWAPELHLIDGHWFIYAAADPGTNAGHRLQVLESTSRSPLGPYTYRGALTTPGNLWSIDPSPLELPDGQLFMFWSGWPTIAAGVQDIYIAAMSNPWTAIGPRIQLSTPQFVWELHPNGRARPTYVNEAPEPIIHGSTVSVSYSGSGCLTPDYALGLLYAPLGSDLLNAASWTKSPLPILRSNPAAGIYGPGSNGWFQSPNGRQTWTAFHAVGNPAGNCGDERQIYVQPVAWNSNDTPDLGGEPMPRARPLQLPGGDPGLP